jgi:hypothetical protein
MPSIGSEDINEEVVEENVVQQKKTGRTSKLYRSFLSQDMFGMPVTLSF